MKIIERKQVNGRIELRIKTDSGKIKRVREVDIKGTNSIVVIVNDRVISLYMIVRDDLEHIYTLDKEFQKNIYNSNMKVSVFNDELLKTLDSDDNYTMLSDDIQQYIQLVYKRHKQFQYLSIK